MPVIMAFIWKLQRLADDSYGAIKISGEDPEQVLRYIHPFPYIQVFDRMPSVGFPNMFALGI
jgi:hypothetical protein